MHEPGYSCTACVCQPECQTVLDAGGQSERELGLAFAKLWLLIVILGLAGPVRLPSLADKLWLPCVSTSLHSCNAGLEDAASVLKTTF